MLDQMTQTANAKPNAAVTPADWTAICTLNSAAANAATGLFLITYGNLAWCMPPWRSLGVAVAVWLAASLAVQQTAWTATTAVALNLAVYGMSKLLRGACLVGQFRSGFRKWSSGRRPVPDAGRTIT
jgi:hypothetical protein